MFPVNHSTKLPVTFILHRFYIFTKFVKGKRAVDLKVCKNIIFVKMQLKIKKTNLIYR